MTTTIRFSWQYDLDLVALAMHPDFDMASWMKKAIYAYARKDENFSIPVPEPVPYHEPLDNYCIKIYINEDSSQDVIQCIHGIRYGQRCSFFKNLFRWYMDGYFLWPYLSGYSYVTKKRGTAQDSPAQDVVRPVDNRIKHKKKKKYMPKNANRAGTPGEGSHIRQDTVQSGNLESVQEREGAGKPVTGIGGVPGNSGHDMMPAGMQHIGDGHRAGGEGQPDGLDWDGEIPDDFDLGAAIDAL